MNPKMFFNRKKLLNFYYETKQFKKAIYWRNSILKMPIKVPSKTVDAIKNDTQKMIIEMNRQIGRQEFEQPLKNEKDCMKILKIKSYKKY